MIKPRWRREVVRGQRCQRQVPPFHVWHTLTERGAASRSPAANHAVHTAWWRWRVGHGVAQLAHFICLCDNGAWCSKLQLNAPLWRTVKHPEVSIHKKSRASRGSVGARFSRSHGRVLRGHVTTAPVELALSSQHQDLEYRRRVAGGASGGRLWNGRGPLAELEEGPRCSLLQHVMRQIISCLFLKMRRKVNIEVQATLISGSTNCKRSKRELPWQTNSTEPTKKFYKEVLFSSLL